MIFIMSEKIKNKRTFRGEVISCKMNQTAVAKVDRVKKHPKYGKRYRVSRKYKVHDERNECRVGQTILFEECRPLSKEKRWRLVQIVG